MPQDLFFRCRRTLPVGRPLLLMDSELLIIDRIGQLKTVLQIAEAVFNLQLDISRHLHTCGVDKTAVKLVASIGS